jgi:hypothetical protein
MHWCAGESAAAAPPQKIGAGLRTLSHCSEALHELACAYARRVSRCSTLLHHPPQHTRTRTRTRTHSHTRPTSYAHTNTHTHRHIQAHTHIHTCTHTHAYTRPTAAHTHTHKTTPLWGQGLAGQGSAFRASARSLLRPRLVTYGAWGCVKVAMSTSSWFVSGGVCQRLDSALARLFLLQTREVIIANRQFVVVLLSIVLLLLMLA